tara:strand:- start:2545 stop:3510 length:966 start_codon:yes stop_codon:yes gene_type:complete
MEAEGGIPVQIFSKFDKIISNIPYEGLKKQADNIPVPIDSKKLKFGKLAKDQIKDEIKCEVKGGIGCPTESFEDRIEDDIKDSFSIESGSTSYTESITVYFDERYDENYNFSIMIPSTWSPFEIPFMDSFPDEYVNSDNLEFLKQSKTIILTENTDEPSLTGVYVDIYPVDGMELSDFMITLDQLSCDDAGDHFGIICKDPKLIENSIANDKITTTFSSMEKLDPNSEFQEIITKVILMKNSDNFFELWILDTPDNFYPNSINEKIENSFYVPQTNNQTDSSGIIIIIGIIFGIAIIGFIVMKNKKTQNQNLKNTARNLSE